MAGHARRQSEQHDAVVIGSGPNGLAAAIALARAGCSVLVREGNEQIGGGARSAELTLPGFRHDVCSAVHPLAVASPFFRELPLEQHGLSWIFAPASLAHPFDGGAAVVVERSLERTAAALGRDADAYRRLIGGMVERWPGLIDHLLGPLRPPSHPLALARFGMHGLRSALGLARARFSGEPARAAWAGMAGHSMLPLERLVTAAFALVLTITAHRPGWPIPKGGAQAIADALASYLRSLGGEIVTGAPVESIDELSARVVLCDLTPRQLLRVAGHRLPSTYRRTLEGYRYGAAAYKMDWALDEPIPWSNPDCARAPAVHLGGTMAEIAAAERAPWSGAHAERPFVILAQPSLFDSGRAPEGKHVAWAYCHVPNGSSFDMSERIESQIERFAPGFRERILARHVMPPAALESHNPNLVGGDINGGTQDLPQLFLRPTWRMYATPLDSVYLCSSSTPPGGGVHGMCGYFAARLALRRTLGIQAQ